MKKMMLTACMVALSNYAYADDKASFAIAEVTPYLDQSLIQENVLAECTALGADLSRSLGTELTAAGYGVNKQSSLDVTKGLAIDVKIASMTAGGSMFTGKQMGGAAKATLYKDGVVVKTKVFTRTSSGGMMGAYKGACSILQRVTTTLGKDVFKWAVE